TMLSPLASRYTSMRSAYWVELFWLATTLPVKTMRPSFWRFSSWSASTVTGAFLSSPAGRASGSAGRGLGAARAGAGAGEAGLIGPDPLLLGRPVEARRLHAQPIARHHHHVTAQLHVLGVAEQLPFVAAHRPGARGLVDPDDDLLHHGLALLLEDLSVLGIQLPAGTAAIL